MTPSADSLREFLKPAAWRGQTPAPEDLAGTLIFDRNRRVTAPDGTEIAYDVHGDKGPWIVLIPGFVCPDNFWRYLLPDLSVDYRVIALDLRGQGLSGLPRPPGRRAKNLTPDDFDFPKQVADIEAVMDAEGVNEAALIGHSMGGQLALEVYRHHRDLVSAIVMLTAPFESPLRTFYGKDFNSLFHVGRLGLQLLPRVSILVWRALLLANPAITHELAKLTRALGPGARLDDMATYYRHMAFLDPLVIMTMAESMRSHSAADLLTQISVPTLIVAGDKDMFTPMTVARVMYEKIPRAEMALIEGAGHGAVIEKPLEVNNAIRAFLDQHLWTPEKEGSAAAP